MAQKLKEETRQAIIAAAKEEFREKGYENASMRSIAEKADITAGNIYRYFQNKEELSRRIIAETSEDIDSILNSIRLSSFSMQPRVFNMKTEQSDLNKMMDELTVKLVALYFNKRSELNIFLNDPDLSGQVIDWFKDTISSLMWQNYMVTDLSKERQILSDAYAHAIFAGLKEIFRYDIDDKKMIVRLVRLYLRRFISMANIEIRKGNEY